MSICGPAARRTRAAQGVARYFVAEHDLDKIFGLCTAPCRLLLGESHYEKTFNLRSSCPPCFPPHCGPHRRLPATSSGGNQGNGESPRGGVTDQDFVYREAKPIAPKLEADEESRAAPITDEHGGHQFADRRRQVQRRQGPQGRAERRAEGDRQAGCSARRPTAATPTRPRRRRRPKTRPSRPATKPSARCSATTTASRSPTPRSIRSAPSAISNRRTLKGNYESCSATLIGPSTVLTAAHCLYNHEAGGWQEDMFFVPGLNGSTANDAPFGGYEYTGRLCRPGLHRQLPGLSTARCCRGTSASSR